MAIKITQIKPEGAQKSAPSAKDYFEEKPRGENTEDTGRIKITKIPSAETPYQRALDEAILRASAAGQTQLPPDGKKPEAPMSQSEYQKALDEAMMKRAAADRKNRERGRRGYNRSHAQEVRGITGDKTKKSITPIIKSAAAGYAADMVGAADTLLRAPSGLNYAASQERGEIEASKKNIAAYTEKLKAAKTEEERQQWQALIDRNKRLIEINSKAAGEQIKNYQDATKGAQEKLQGTYQKLRKIASDNMEKANEGLTPVGKYLNNVGVAGAQMAADAALGGGSALGPMFLRVFGGNSQEAMETADKPGMSAAEQLDAQNRALLYGTASGAVSIATEKISNVAAPFKKAFGGGFLDKAIDGAIAKMNGSAAGRLALSFLSEGGEEVIEDIVQPALQTIYNGQSAGQNYSELDAAEILNDFLVGGALGLIGSGVEGIHNADARLAAERAAGEEAAPTAEQQNTVPAQPAAAQEGAQGAGEGNLTPVPQNAAQGAQEASTSVDTNPKNHTPEEQKRVQSAFMSKEKGSTGTVLNMENISPQVTSEAPQRANASFDNTAPQESGGVKAQEGAESAQTAQADNTTTAGGMNHGGQEVQNHAGGAEFAEAGERTDLSNGNGRRGTGSSAGEQIGGVGGSGSQRTAEQSRTALERQNHARNLRLEPISSAELGVRAGTDTKSVTVLPESAWDARLQETAQRIRRETGKTPVFVLGSIHVRGRDRAMRVRGVWAGSQIIVQADHMNVSPEQIASHEIFHEYADQNPGLIQAVERSIREKFGDKEFDSIVESYIRNLRGIIDIDENAADYEVEQALLDVKNEILADAYADINAFGEKAGKYQENVRQTLEERGIVDTGRETAAATERRTGPPEKYSVLEEVEGENGTYGKGVMLDTNLFDGIRPRDWGKTLGRYVYNNMAGMELTAYDAAGKPETIYLARTNDRVQKDGAKNSRKVIDKLARSTGDNIRSLAVVHLDEALTTSRYENSTDEHNHQWMDENGWEHRKTYLQDRSGNIYEATLNIADGRDRKILYDINNIRLIDKAKSPGEHTATGDSQRSRYQETTAGGARSEAKAGEITGGAVPSAVTGGARSTSRNFSNERIADESGNVKSPTLGDEIRRQIMGEDASGAAKKDAAQELSRGVTVSGSLADTTSAASENSIPKDGKRVKYSAFNEEVARQLAGEEREKQRYSVESDEFYERLDEELADRAAEQNQRHQRQQESTYAKAERDAKREDAGNLKPVRKVTKPTEVSKPTIAKRDLQKAILDTFSVPVEDRDALRTTIDRYADSVIKNGKLTEEERDAFFDKMYESGIIKTTADETMRSMGQYVAHRKIYVPAEVKALFGQDWNGFRKRAYAAGIYLTNDKSAIGVDAFNAELSEQLPTIFDKTETDGRRVLERIVQLAEEGQAERMSLSGYIAEIAGKDSVRGEQLYRELEQKMDNALQTFAEKADLEIKLRDRTGIKLAQQREQFDQRQQAQRAQRKEWESAEKAKKQAENKERERAARERDLIREAKARERRTEAARRRRENRELREMQQKTLKQLQWLSKNRNRAPEAMKKAWDEALGDIDIYAARAADEMHWSKKHEATWGDLRDMYLEAKKGAENGDPKYVNFLPSKELERIVDRLDKDKIADMDIDALKDLYKAAVGLRTEFYNRNKVLNDEADRLFQEVYTDATRELRSAPSGGKDKSKAGGLLNELINNQQLSPMNIIQRMGGWNPNGTFYSMAKQLESGERNVRDYTVKANRLLENFLNEHQDWVKKADGQGKDAIWYELEVPELIKLGNGDKPIFGETVKVYMTPAQKVHLYLESKNYDNLLHMTGGRTFVDKELYSKGKRREALERGTTIKLAPESVQKIVSDLTPEEAELARILKGYYNDFAPKAINKVSNVLLGYDKAVTKNYAPIYTNQNYTKSEFGVFDMTAEGVGNLKERKRSTTPSYNISAFDAFEKHVDQTARYTGMAIPTRNMSTLMSWRGEHDSMQDALAHEWGGKANEYIKDLVTEMQGEKSEKSTVAEIIPEKVFSNYISSVFGFNPSIVFKQLGSIPMGSAYLGAKNFPSVKQIRHIDKALISKYTQELAWRTMGYSMPETKQLKDNPNWTETNKAVNTIFGGGAITAMDGWAASILWPQAENKVRREHPELKIGTAEQVENGESPFYQEVAREFNDAVARSQSTSDIIHQSTLRRSKNPVARAFTLFKSDSAQTYNAIRQKYGEWQYYKRSGASEETLKKAKRGIGEAVLAALVNAVWSGTVTFLVAAVKNGAKRYRDDDDELTIESALKEFGMGLVGDLAGVMAGGEELADIIGNGITGEKWYRIEAPGLEQMDDLIEGINERLGSFFEHAGELHNIIQNKGDVGEFLHREGRDIAGWIREVAKDAATYLPGVPANNIEAYLLGTVRTLSPELAAAYEDAFMRVEKSDLKHQHGRTLTAKVRDLLKDRTGKDSKEAAGVIASLYDSGHTDAVPTATPSYVTIDKVKHELNAYQTQVYEKAWRKAVGGELSEMVRLPAFIRAGEETQEKMLKKLYDYASDMAKAEVFDKYEMKKSTREMSESAKYGMSVAVQIVAAVSGENDPKGLSLPTP
mgnify:CR=1 FL=1